MHTVSSSSHVAALSPDFTSSSSVLWIDSILSWKCSQVASLPDFPTLGSLVFSQDACIHPMQIFFDMLLTRKPISTKISLLHSWLQNSTPLQLAIDRQIFSIKIASVVQKGHNPDHFLASVSCKQFLVDTRSLSLQFSKQAIGIIKPFLISSIPSQWIRKIL